MLERQERKEGRKEGQRMNNRKKKEWKKEEGEKEGWKRKEAKNEGTKGLSLTVHKTQFQMHQRSQHKTREPESDRRENRVDLNSLAQERTF